MRLPLPARVEMVGHDQLSARLRVAATQPSVDLTWMALDGEAKPIFIRRFSLPPGEKWVALDQPLRLWRWSDGHVGDWDDVRQLALRIDSRDVTQLDVDDLRLTGAAPRDARATWLLRLAFGADHPPRVAQSEGFMVATEAVDAFSDEDLHRLLTDAKHARAFVRRIFIDAVRPTNDLGSPALLLIFSDNANRSGFLDRLGDAWNARIVQRDAQGFTVHDIGTATYDKERGVRRPVYLHEAVHAIVARDLRLQVGYAPHKPLQEGIANYIQLCVHPKSIDRDAYVKAFAEGVDESGKRIFKPLEFLFAPVVKGDIAGTAEAVVAGMATAA